MSFIKAMKKANNGVAHPVNVPGDIVSFLSRGRGYGDILIKDNFNGAGDLSGTVPDAINVPGNAWVEVAGDWERVAGQAIITASVSAIATYESDTSDISVVASMDADGVGASGARGVIIRYVDTSNYWSIVIGSAGGNFQIIERNAAVSTARAGVTVSPPVASPQTVTITVTASGSTISAVLDVAGVIYNISYGLATFQETETIIGMRSRTTVDKWNSYEAKKL